MTPASLTLINKPYYVPFENNGGCFEASPLLWLSLDRGLCTLFCFLFLCFGFTNSLWESMLKKREFATPYIIV